MKTATYRLSQMVQPNHCFHFECNGFSHLKGLTKLPSEGIADGQYKLMSEKNDINLKANTIYDWNSFAMNRCLRNERLTRHLCSSWKESSSEGFNKTVIWRDSGCAIKMKIGMKNYLCCTAKATYKWMKTATYRRSQMVQPNHCFHFRCNGFSHLKGLTKLPSEGISNEQY